MKPNDSSAGDKPGPMTQRGPDGRAHETPEMETRAHDAQREAARPVPRPPITAPTSPSLSNVTKS